MKAIINQAIVALTVLLAMACTQESQNKIGRSIQNWTGTDGVLEFSDYSTSYVFFENPR
jgi:hypothetical protein